MRPNWVNDLLENGRVAHSRVNTANLKTLKELGIVRIHVNKTRRQVIVTDKEQFDQWVGSIYPQRQVDETFPQRAQNVMRGRDSKSGVSSHQVLPVLLKWFDPDPNHLCARLTAEYGLCGFTTDSLTKITWPKEWWLLTIENWESFNTTSQETATIPIIVLYLGGNPSDVLLRVLEKLPQPSRVTHFGDYDWAGLRIFQRVQKSLPQAKLYLPEDIEELFQKFGKHGLAGNQIPLEGNMSAKVDKVAHLISQYNAGLEQEIVVSQNIAHTFFDHCGLE
jgi:hypothetical protein